MSGSTDKSQSLHGAAEIRWMVDAEVFMALSEACKEDQEGMETVLDGVVLPYLQRRGFLSGDYERGK